LVPLAFSDTELTSETIYHFRRFGRTPRTGDRPIARSLPTWDSTAQKNAGIYPCIERDSNPRSQCSSDQRPYELQTARRNYTSV